LSQDITPILEGWDHDPETMRVRLVPGLDGREKLQLRLDLGLLQMELDGRPDGERPFGFESLLDYHEARAKEAGDTPENYRLDDEDREALMREGIQYYHRYVALYHLGRYDLVARDTDRNLRLFTFVRRHSTQLRDILAFDQYRPYVATMKARALAQEALDHDNHREALKHIDDGIATIRSFLEDYEQEENAAECQELNFLEAWRKELDQERRLDPVERLEEQLDRAIAAEDYEEAARLRDQIQRLRHTISDSGSGSSDSAHDAS